jgi:hypothetical protein
MKFLIKTSAVGISEYKFAQRGEYETNDEKEITRLKSIAERFPNDVEILTAAKEAAIKTSKEEKKSKK